MAQPISNTLQGGGLLTAPKATANTPINFGALQNTSAPSSVNLNLPKPQMVTGLVNPTTPAAPAPAAAPVKPLQPTTATQPVAPVAQTTTTPPPGTANGTVAPSQGLFSSVASSLANNSPNNNAQIAQNATDIANKYQALALPYQKNALGQELGEGSTGLAPIAAGNAALIANAAGSYMSGLSSQENAALSANSQGLTAQSQTQSALSSSGSLTQPSATFPFVFDPATASFSTSGGNLQTSISGGVQQAISNPTLYSSLEGAIQATYGQAAAGMFQQAFIQAGGNPSIAAGQATGAQALAAAPGQGQAAGEAAVIASGGQTQAQNNITAGTTATSAASDAYKTATAGVQAANSTYSGLAGVSSQLNDTLSGWHNNGKMTNVNQIINQIAGITSDPNYQKFVSALTNTQAMYRSILGSTGTNPNAATEESIDVLNPGSSALTIQTALNQLLTDAYDGVVAPPKQQQSIYAKQLGIQ